MVTLVVPTDLENRYIVWRNTVIGPFDLTVSFSGEVVDLPSDLATMSEAKGIWHENDVTHTKVEGDILYHPFANGLHPAPTSQWLDRIAFSAYNLSNQVITLYAEMGLAGQRRVSFYKSSATQGQQWAFERTSDPRYHVRYIASYSSGKIVFFEAWEITSITKVSNSYVNVRYKKTTYKVPPGYTGGVDWNQRQSFDTIKSMVSFVVNSVMSFTETGYWYRVAITDDTILSPTRIKEHIDAIAQGLVPDTYPIPDTDYGDLAMQATGKVQKNHVNMIAFLRDLRHPTEMIPKLRNLAHLKTLADDYLTVKYGILPTISDLQNIIAACKRLSPFVDRNGFNVYTANSTQELEMDDKTFKLTQYIKLAIDNEDCEIQALTQRLDSMGTLPTLENVWDLVPYSFVVDWFLDVGKLLERVDTRLRLAMYNIRYATMSRKTETTGYLQTSSSCPYEGSVNLVQYHRWVSDQCPVPPLSLQPTFQDFDHWLESGALLVQRAK